MSPWKELGDVGWATLKTPHGMMSAGPGKLYIEVPCQHEDIQWDKHTIGARAVCQECKRSVPRVECVRIHRLPGSPASGNSLRETARRLLMEGYEA